MLLESADAPRDAPRPHDGWSSPTVADNHGRSDGCEDCRGVGSGAQSALAVCAAAKHAGLDPASLGLGDSLEDEAGGTALKIPGRRRYRP